MLAQPEFTVSISFFEPFYPQPSANPTLYQFFPPEMQGKTREVCDRYPYLRVILNLCSPAMAILRNELIQKSIEGKQPKRNSMKVLCYGPQKEVYRNTISQTNLSLRSENTFVIFQLSSQQEGLTTFQEIQQQRYQENGTLETKPKKKNKCDLFMDKMDLTFGFQRGNHLAHFFCSLVHSL